MNRMSWQTCLSYVMNRANILFLFCLVGTALAHAVMSFLYFVIHKVGKYSLYFTAPLSLSLSLSFSRSLSHTPVCAHTHTDSRTHKQILQHCLVSQIIWRPRSCIIGSLARLDWWNLAQSACGSSMCQWLITCILCFANKLNQLLIPLTCGAKGDTELTLSSATSSYQFSHVSLAVIFV